MAYMSQVKKKEIATKLKAAMKPYDVQYSLGVRNHSTIVMNIKSSSVDFIQNYIAKQKESNNPRIRENLENLTYLDVNPYHYKDQFTGKALEIIQKAMVCLNDGNYDNSDIMTDYFDVGWYIDINIGKWDKPFEAKAA